MYVTIERAKGGYAPMIHKPGKDFTPAGYLANTSEDARNVWLSDERNASMAPLIYGYFVISRDENERPVEARCWSRWRGNMYYIHVRYWYAKTGDGKTINISVRRKDGRGMARTSKSFRDPGDSIKALAATLVEENAKQVGEPEQQALFAPATPRPDSRVNKEDWSA